MRHLLIETCTERGIIAVADEKGPVFQKELPFGSLQSRSLVVYIDEILREFKTPLRTLDAIGVGIGPGSYTGIRSGVAVAQAFAYARKIPLIGVTSLNGFVPSDPDVRFAAVIDARIGGVYIRKGTSDREGVIRYFGDPFLSPIEQVGDELKEIDLLISPSVKTLRAKLDLRYPGNSWKWTEASPCVKALSLHVRRSFSEGRGGIPPEKIEILYLRETEAERTKRASLEFSRTF